MSRHARPVLDLPEHGRSGWRKGCGCPLCRAAHSADVAAWRARRRHAAELEQLDEQARAQAEADAQPPAPDGTQAPALLDAGAPAGAIEQGLDEDLATLVGEPPWKATLSALARANARIIDQAPRHQRLDVLSGVQLRFLDILDRLRRLPSPAPDGGVPAGVPADWSGLGDPD